MKHARATGKDNWQGLDGAGKGESDQEQKGRSTKAEDKPRNKKKQGKRQDISREGRQAVRWAR